ncbi:CBM35 domain-containing protein [Paenibacillus sp. MCAF20]
MVKNDRVRFTRGWLVLLAAVLLMQTVYLSPWKSADSNVEAAAPIAEETQDLSAALATDGYSFEAEAEGNVLSGRAERKTCAEATGCSGAGVVGGLWDSSSVTMNGITVEEAGIYTMTVHYISGDPRSFAVSVNGGAGDHYDLPRTADWETLGTYAIEIELQAGSNTIRFDDEGGYSPDIDRIVLSESGTGEPGGPATGYEAEAAVNVRTGNAAVSGCQPATGCSGGLKVGNLWGGSTLQFRDIAAEEAGIYTLSVSYVSGDPRPVSIKVNEGQSENYALPKTGRLCNRAIE